jgi:hypothetical protein
MVERRQRVLRPERGAAAMRVDQRAREKGGSQTGILASNPKLSASARSVPSRPHSQRAEAGELGL